MMSSVKIKLNEPFGHFRSANFQHIQNAYKNGDTFIQMIKDIHLFYREICEIK